MSRSWQNRLHSTHAKVGHWSKLTCGTACPTHRRCSSFTPTCAYQTTITKPGTVIPPRLLKCLARISLKFTTTTSSRSSSTNVPTLPLTLTSLTFASTLNKTLKSSNSFHKRKASSHCSFPQRDSIKMMPTYCSSRSTLQEPIIASALKSLTSPKIKLERREPKSSPRSSR